MTYQPRLLCLAMISAVDESIGIITAALKSKGGGAFWDNTLIIFSSDNGRLQLSQQLSDYTNNCLTMQPTVRWPG